MFHRGALAITTICALLAVGCSQDDAPAGEETPFSMPAPRDDAIARAEAGGEPASLLAADQDTPYIVHAACEGAESMTYTVHVDERELKSREFQCGKVVRHTAFIGEGGETVRIELSGDGTGFAEIVPHAEG